MGLETRMRMADAARGAGTIGGGWRPREESLKRQGASPSTARALSCEPRAHSDSVLCLGRLRSGLPGFGRRSLPAALIAPSCSFKTFSHIRAADTYGFEIAMTGRQRGRQTVSGGPLRRAICAKTLGKSGEPGRNRTFNQQIKSLLLCQLSYGPTVPACGRRTLKSEART